MAKAKLKTQKNRQSVSAFINGIEDPERKKNCKKILALMKEITGKKPVMWGSSIVGFGDYHYKYDSGREGDFFRTGFSPRKQALTIYIMPGYQEFGLLMEKLGPHTLGKSCLYIKHLDDIHIQTLKKIITKGLEKMQKLYPE